MMQDEIADRVITKLSARKPTAAEQFAEDALGFEQATSGMAKVPDTAETFARYHGVMKHALIKAGADLHEPWPVQRFPSKSRHPRIGFFMPTATLLAHSRNLLTYLDALASYGAQTQDKSDPLGQRQIEPFVYTFAAEASVGAEFTQAYAAHRVRHLGHEAGLLDHWRVLRVWVIEDRLDAMVFVSVVQGMAFATSFGVAPKHIWWAHKWHGLELPGLDGYIDACHPFTDGPLEIAGRTWRSTYTALPQVVDHSKAAEAKRIRATMDVEVVFGWMGRGEKITSDYLTAVGEILRQVPDSIYVYTSREPRDDIEQAFAAAGLGDRVAYIGWVDVTLWSQVIDVYLDTFPFQSGHSAYAMMAAGKPVVWLHDEATAKEQSASGLIRDTWDQGAREIFDGMEPWATTPEGYVAIAAAFAGDLREDIGAEMRCWIERFMMDRRLMASSVTRAILEILEN
jgi:hypothetical protein